MVIGIVLQHFIEVFDGARIIEDLASKITRADNTATPQLGRPSQTGCSFFQPDRTPTCAKE